MLESSAESPDTDVGAPKGGFLRCGRLSSATLTCWCRRRELYRVSYPLERGRGAPQRGFADSGCERVTPFVLGGVDGVERRPADGSEFEQLGPLVVRVVPVAAQVVGDRKVGDRLHALARQAEPPGNLGDCGGLVPALVEDQPS